MTDTQAVKMMVGNIESLIYAIDHTDLNIDEDISESLDELMYAAGDIWNRCHALIHGEAGVTHDGG